MKAASIVLKNARLGWHIKKSYSIVTIGAVAIVCLDLILEIRLLPLLYGGIPVPFGETAKPIGAALIPAAFFNSLLIAVNIFGFAYILYKAGFNIGLIPTVRNDWLDVLAFFVFLTSGMMIWYFPVFFLPLAITGLYLLVGPLS